MPRATPARSPWDKPTALHHPCAFVPHAGQNVTTGGNVARRASLIAGGVSGVVLIGSAALAASQPAVGLAVASVVSLALVARFAKSAAGKRASGVAKVMIGGGVAVLVTAGLALAA